MDLEELAMRLKHGFYQTAKHSDGGPIQDPKFWQEYAQWWVKNGQW